MGNCLVAQSGGPSVVINATLAGIIKANQINPIYEHVYGGLHGIEGILNQELVDLTNLSEENIDLLKQTASSALGTCRYQLIRGNKIDFAKVFSILEAYNIDALFYIGGNDSMDTVAALSEYAASNHLTKHRFIGCPKTIDNDLVSTDHTPGFGSAAKLLVNVVKTTWLDLNAYDRDEIFILETMGRNAGWLAASSVLSNNVDVLILPEVAFQKDKFIKKVREVMMQKRHCYIVVSEGAKYLDGSYVAANNGKKDSFGHGQLGGIAEILKQMLMEEGVCYRVKTQVLATLSRCYSPTQSKIDVEEAYSLGLSAHMHSSDETFTGKMVAIERNDTDNYNVKYVAINALEIANKVKTIPLNWIYDNYSGMSNEFYQYCLPLIQGEPNLKYINGMIDQLVPFYSTMRNKNTR